MEFLARNGYRLNVTPYELYKYTVQVAGEDAAGNWAQILAEMMRWIEQRLVPIE